eukprot:EG_transcript_21348
MCLLKALASGYILLHDETRPQYKHLQPWTNCSLSLATAAPRPKQVIDCLSLKSDKPSYLEVRYGYIWSLLHAIAFLTDIQDVPGCGGDRRAVLHIHQKDRESNRPHIPTASFVAELEKWQSRNIIGRTDVQLVTDAPGKVHWEYEEYVAKQRLSELFALHRSPQSGNPTIFETLQAMRCGNPLVLRATSYVGVVGMALKVYTDLEECRPGHLILMDTGTWWKGFYVHDSNALLGFEQHNTSWGEKWDSPPNAKPCFLAEYLG